MRFPRLDAAKIISIDVETHDPDLETRGPGMLRDGYLCGLAVGAEDSSGKIDTWYFPFGHVEGKNLSERSVLEWARDNLSGDQPKVGANILYDLMYLDHSGVSVGGSWHDVLMEDFLLDENHFKYDLDHVAERVLGDRKHKAELHDWLKERFKGKPESNIWRAPSSLVGVYAKKDAELPLKIHREHAPALKKQGLERVAKLESRLLPMLLAMSKKGVRVDLEKAEILRDDLARRIERDSRALGGINVDAPTELAPLFDKLGIKYGFTEKSKQPSFAKDFLENHPHPVAKQVMDLRKWKKFKSTFLEGYILGKHVNGRLYPSFNPRGARTGRFSSSRPNLQNIPKRDQELGPLVRSLFVPDPGESWWKLDYSQIEYRYLVHLGTGPVAETLKHRYRTDHSTDIHQEVADMLDGKATVRIDRGKGKNLNFGIVYGLGVRALAVQLAMAVDDTRELRETYNRLFPFAKQLSDKASRLAAVRGFVRTVLGRRRRFDSWEAADWDLGKELGAFPSRTEAQAVVRKAIDELAENGSVPTGAVRRAFTYKALNSVVQGSAADIMKEAMAQIWESGLCEETVPMLTVHDELCFSTNDEAAVMRAKDIMENSIELSVPLLVDVERGNNWGECK